MRLIWTFLICSILLISCITKNGSHTPLDKEYILNELKNQRDVTIEIDAERFDLIHAVNYNMDRVSEDHLFTASLFIDNLPTFFNHVQNTIKQESASGELDFYYEHYLEGTDPSELKKLGIDPMANTTDQLKSLYNKVHLNSIWFDKDHTDTFATFTYMIMHKHVAYSNYVLTVSINNQGDVIGISMDS